MHQLSSGETMSVLASWLVGVLGRLGGLDTSIVCEFY